MKLMFNDFDCEGIGQELRRTPPDICACVKTKLRHQHTRKQPCTCRTRNGLVTEALGMNERRFVNPSRIVLSDADPYFYPLPNKLTVDLCEDIPPRESDDPLTVCLLGAGDVRNVFLVTYQRRKRGDRRRLKFYVNDHNPAIIARYILLLTLAAQAPQKGRRLVQFVESFVHVYADLFLTDDNRTRVDAIFGDLLANFPSQGCHLTVPEADQLWHVKKTWALWLTDRQRADGVSKSRQEKNKLRLSRKRFRNKEGGPLLGRGSVLGDLFPMDLVLLNAIMSNCDIIATPTLQDEVLKYFRSGNIGGQLQNRLNPMLFDPEMKEFPHYTSNPFLSFISATEDKDYKDSEQTFLATLKSCLKRLLSTFAHELKSGNIQIIFDAGDCNSFLSERLPTETTFDVIDTTNLTDNLGLTNLLVVGIPRLNRNEPYSTLWTNTLKAHISYKSLDEFLRDSLGFQYDVISSMLQTVCKVPFESARTFDEESGRMFRSNAVSGVFLKWTHAFSESASPDVLDLAPRPRPDACFFRQFVDAILSSIYDSYTGRLHNLTSDNMALKALLPREFTMTVSTLVHVLCQATKILKHPRQVFDYLYQKVKFRRVARAEPVPDEPLWGVFALDVQMTASLICPDEYKPLEPLHPLLVDQSLQTRSCHLRHTAGRKGHPTPIVGWLLMEDYKPLDGMLFHTMLTGLSAKVINASATAGNLQKQLLQLAGNVFDYIERNAYRLQFIDSVSVSFPDSEALVTLPSSLFSSDHSYAIVGVSILDGTFLYSPLTCRSLQAATTVCVQTQTLVYPNPAAEEFEKGSDLDAEVSVLREYHDRFDAIVTSKKPLRSTWKMASKKISPLEIRLSIGDAPTRESAVTESLCLSMKLPTHVDVNPEPRLLEFIDEQNVKVSLFKSRHALYPIEKKLELESLNKWPANRPLGVDMSMFTDNESQMAESSGGLPFGHDPYLDARKAVYVTYMAFADQPTMMARKVIKLRQDGKKLFRAVSSFEKGFIGYTPSLLITPLGTPVVELHYIYHTSDPPPPPVDQFIGYINSRKDILVTNTRGTDEMIDVLLNLLERNARLLKDTSPVQMGGVSMQRSFFVPIYPKEHRTTSRRPATSRSAFMDQLEQWRRDNIPLWHGDALFGSS